MKRKAHDGTREESQTEFHDRVQNQITEDSWNGVDTVGQEFPTHGRVFDSDSTPTSPLIWHDDTTNRRRGR